MVSKEMSGGLVPKSCPTLEPHGLEGQGQINWGAWD